MHDQAREWWYVERPKFNLVASQFTINEASVGAPSAAADRLEMFDGLPLVPLGTDVVALANLILSSHVLPQKAAADAVHVAAPAIAGVNYLLALNCKRIANAHELPRAYRLLKDHGYSQLLICTPAEFLGGDDDDEESDT